jgi:hypothetical protein
MPMPIGIDMETWTRIYYRQRLYESLKNFEKMLGGAKMGFKEMVQFFQVATSKQMDKMKKIVDAEDVEGFVKLINVVLG